MDKQFWLSIKEKDFALPVGYPIPVLTENLLATIGSIDPELRDTLGLEVFYHWLQQGIYDRDALRDLIAHLLRNLQQGIGETEGDAIFLRSFSALWLSLIVENDSETPVLEPEDIASILEAALAYFTAESDLRGYVPIKGYAHGIAHASDLLGALASSAHTNAGDHLRILACMAGKLNASTHGIYLYNEDSRIARATARVFLRDTLTLSQIENWLTSLSALWNGAWQNEDRTRAYNNGRNFVRALVLLILNLKVDKVPNEEELLQLLLSALSQATPWE